MKLYTCYSDSHKILFDNYFYPSLPEDVDLVVTHLQQIGDGSYKNSGWRLSIMEKVKVILRALDENDYFIWSDCDVQFFGPIADTLLSELGDFELACQNDSRGIYCAGFFICKSTFNTKKLFHKVFDTLSKEEKTNDDDQDLLNKLIKNNCKSKFLSNRFWTVGVSLEEKSKSVVRWSNQDFEIPQNILVHHANWTVDIENKIKLLEMVRKMQIDQKLISLEYAELNRQLHEQNAFYGIGGGKHVDAVIKLTEDLNTKSVLDYGCGKGRLAKSLPFPICEYDPGIPGKETIPEPADIVVCTDVLEHIEPDLIGNVLSDLKRCIKMVGYFVISTRPATKTLPDGRNTHLLQRGKSWWEDILKNYFDLEKLTEADSELHVVVRPRSEQE